MKVTFVKMQALGNDFLLLDCLRETLPVHRELVRILCERRRGIGADQLLVLLRSERADFRMRVFNADGGEVEMCGNGVRCLARYLVSRGLAREGEIRIETRAGIVTPCVKGDMVTVDMGVPVLDGEKIPVALSGRIVDREVKIAGEDRRITCVSMGNPHCVVFVDDPGRTPVGDLGPKIERDNLFPMRVNVEFVRVVSDDLIQARVWERGAGETTACGTGACAAAVASALNRKTGRDVTVRMPGGDLKVRWLDDGRVLLSGPADEVFTGEINVERVSGVSE